MKIACVSDIHGRFNMAYPKADVLIIAGDILPNFSSRSKKTDCFHQGMVLEDQFAPAMRQLLKRKVYENILITPGNHDRVFADELDKCKKLLGPIKNLYLLIDEAIKIRDVNFYCSPWSNWFGGHWWVYNLPDRNDDPKRAKEVSQACWAQIPKHTDVLVTHGPPKYILDRVDDLNSAVGCPHLNEKVFDGSLERLKLHVFGHIHESYGQVVQSNITFVNAALMDGGYLPVNQIQVVEI